MSTVDAAQRRPQRKTKAGGKIIGSLPKTRTGRILRKKLNPVADAPTKLDAPAVADAADKPYLRIRVKINDGESVVVLARPSELKAARMIVERAELGLGAPASDEVKALADAELIDDVT